MVPWQWLRRFQMDIRWYPGIGFFGPCWTVGRSEHCHARHRRFLKRRPPTPPEEKPGAIRGEHESGPWVHGAYETVYARRPPSLSQRSRGAPHSNSNPSQIITVAMRVIRRGRSCVEEISGCTHADRVPLRHL